MVNIQKISTEQIGSVPEPGKQASSQPLRQRTIITDIQM